MKEGWGITSRIGEDGLEFFVSDSTENMFVVDPFTWKIKKRLIVQTHWGVNITGINDMTIINDKIYANAFLKDLIVKIDPDTGVIEQ